MTRRRALLSLAALAVTPLFLRLGRVVRRAPRLVRPAELSAVPWIGHC